MNHFYNIFESFFIKFLNHFYKKFSEQVELIFVQFSYHFDTENLTQILARPKSRASFSSSLTVKDGSNSFNIGKCESTGAKPSVEIYWENSEGERVSTIETKSVKRGKTIDSISHLTLNNVDKKIHHQESGLKICKKISFDFFGIFCMFEKKRIGQRWIVWSEIKIWGQKL